MFLSAESVTSLYGNVDSSCDKAKEQKSVMVVCNICHRKEPGVDHGGL